MEVISPEALLQQQQQQAETPYDASYSAPLSQDNKSNFMRWQLDTDDLLEDIENKLRGNVKVKEFKDGQEVISWHPRKKGEPLLNEKGISRVMTILGTRLTRLDMMSDLDEEKITIFAKDCADCLNDLLYEDGQDFDVKDSDWPLIIGLIFDQVYIALRRSYKGGERRFISTVERLVEQIMSRHDTGQDKSALSPLNPINFFKRK